MPEGTEINELRGKDFIIYPYTNHLQMGGIDLITFYVPFIFFTIYDVSLWALSISLLLIPFRILMHFVYPAFNHDRIILRKQEIKEIIYGYAFFRGSTTTYT